MIIMYPLVVKMPSDYKQETHTAMETENEAKATLPTISMPGELHLHVLSGERAYTLDLEGGLREVVLKQCHISKFATIDKGAMIRNTFHFWQIW